jgi:Fe-S cluster biosynthesis and repair protein YggX
LDELCSALDNHDAHPPSVSTQTAISAQSLRLIQKATPMARMVQCIKLEKQAEGLDFAPYPGELGKRIWEGVSKEAWAAWLKHQTMLVNENRLNLADARARQYLARQMEAHFFGGGADAAQGYVPPAA